MKTKSILTGCLTVAAMAACLIPMLAQEPGPKDRVQSNAWPDDIDDAAQRESYDLFTAAKSARPPQSQGYAIAPSHPNFAIAQWSQPNNQNQQPAPGALATQGSIFGRSAFDTELAKAINESNAEVGKLIKQLKETEVDSEKESLKEKIKTELDLQYEAYLAHHEKPLKQLEERLAQLREEFEARKQAKVDLVKLRLDTIWYDAQGLGWPSNRTTSIYGDGRGLGQNPLVPYPTRLDTRFPNQAPAPGLGSPIPPTPPPAPPGVPASPKGKRANTR